RSFYLCSFVVVLLLSACSPAPKTQDDAKAPAEEPAQTNQFFGAKINLDQAISYEDLLQKMEGSDSLSIKVKGRVSAVCQKKGCWMNIVSDQEGNPDMFVKFKDYGFFMPLDIAGREVVMDGYAFKEVTSVEELRHYAEDDKKSKEEIEAITEPEEELKFMASGVILLPEQS
ncbi:MAG: DUF4920 domain-containing protein, partial [Bacteroidota bacterium]